MTDLKILFQHGHLDEHQVRQRLTSLGYDERDQDALLQVWADEQKQGRTGLGTAHILAYLASGVLSKDQAYEHLVKDGMRIEDARFLVDHPLHVKGIYAHPLEPHTVTAAFIDGIIGIDDARQRLVDLKVDPREIELQLRVAAVRIARGVKPRKPPKELTEGQILRAMRLGLVEPTWAVRELEHLGYVPIDAYLLTAIELVDETRVLPDFWKPLE